MEKDETVKHDNIPFVNAKSSLSRIHVVPYCDSNSKTARKQQKIKTKSNSWRRDTEAELKQQGTNWSGMARAAQNRVSLFLVGCLASEQHASVSQRRIYIFYSVLGCVLPLQKVALRQSLPSFSVLCYSRPYRSLLPHNIISPTTFWSSDDLTRSVCHSVLLLVHLLSFIRAMCPAHFNFVLVTYWTMSVTLVLYLMLVLRILSFSLTVSILLSIAC